MHGYVVFIERLLAGLLRSEMRKLQLQTLLSHLTCHRWKLETCGHKQNLK